MSAPQADLTGVIIGAAATILGAAITVVVGKLWEQHLKIRDELRARKAPIYERHIATFFKIFFAHKITGKAADQKELLADFAAVAEQMIVWGSADVIKAWNNCRAALQSGGAGQEGIDRLEDVFMAIRKDLGNDDRDMKKGEVLRLFVNDLPPAGERQ
jgi:hypothetical protein